MSCARNQTAELLGAAVVYCTRCSPHETEPGIERRAR